MNNSFDRFMKNALLASLGVIAVSALLIFSYMDSKDLSFQDVFQDGQFYFGNNDNDFNGFRLGSNLSSSFSNYDLLTLNEDQTFEALDNIEINATLEEVIFIHDEREDIRVTFEREVPDTKAYTVDYETRTTNSQIIIDVDLKTNSFYADQNYKGVITVYLPEDHELDHLTINRKIGSEDIVLPKYVKHLDVSVNFGSLKIINEYPLDSLRLSINAGDLYFKTTAPVEVIKASVDTGEMNFDILSEIGELNITTDIGEIYGFLEVSPKKVDVSCDLGDIELEFDEPVNKLVSQLDLGDLSINVSDDDESTVYVDTNLVDYDSHLDSTTNKSKANIFVEMNLGDVDIY